MPPAYPGVPKTWEDAVAQQPGAGVTVLISTRFGGIYFAAAQDFEEALTALGCTAFNPNTQGANQAWNKAFSAEMLKIQKSQSGFMLQIQGDNTGNISENQEGEQNNAQMANIPMLSTFCTVVGPGKAGLPIHAVRLDAWKAIDRAKQSWATGAGLGEVVRAGPSLNPELNGMEAFASDWT